jgi:hypothetical protein
MSPSLGFAFAQFFYSHAFAFAVCDLKLTQYLLEIDANRALCRARTIWKPLLQRSRKSEKIFANDRTKIMLC